MDYFTIEIPASDEPQVIQVRLRDPEYHDSEGLMHVEPRALEWDSISFGPPASCNHSESICRICIESWANDYEIKLPSA